MALESLSGIGPGGSGFQGEGSGSVASVLTELQGLTVTLATGALANTKIDVAAIRDEDTIITCLNNDAGTITDITSSMSIVDLHATGTLTLDTVIATDACAVNGVTYTFQAGDATSYGQVKLGASDTLSAAALAAAINAYENSIDNDYSPDVVATSDAAVVTITAVVEGTAGNAITITAADATITPSGATLAGGTATGGVKSTGATDQILMVWFNKS